MFGTWGVDEAQCSLPQEVSGAPFILTESRFDQHEAHCDTSFTAAHPDGWTMSMACSVEGDLQTFTEWVDIADGKLLRRFDLDGEAKEFIRCSG